MGTVHRRRSRELPVEGGRAGLCPWGQRCDAVREEIAYTAAQSAKIAGAFIAQGFGGEDPDPGAPHNICYPLVSQETAIMVRADWSHGKDKDGKPAVITKGASDNDAKANLLLLRREWRRVSFGRCSERNGRTAGRGRPKAAPPHPLVSWKATSPKQPPHPLFAAQALPPRKGTCIAKKRRGFLKACAGPQSARRRPPLRESGGPWRRGQGVLGGLSPGPPLSTRSGRPIAAAALKGQTNYVFLYPFSETPCFLVDLGEPIAPAPLKLKDGTEYAWPAARGRRSRSSPTWRSARTPSRTRSPGSRVSEYYGPEEKGALAGAGNVITCCVHASIFDPAKGAEVIQAPAEIPLTTVLLEWDPEERCALRLGPSGTGRHEGVLRGVSPKRQEPVGKESRLVTLDAYSKIVIGC